MTDLRSSGLPYGVFSVDGGRRRLGTRAGESVIDLAGLAEAGALPAAAGESSLDALLAGSPELWAEVRGRLLEAIDSGRAADHLVPLNRATMHLPFTVADYVDFYSSEHHARNLGRMFRPDSEPLLPNWKHLPVGYHGRAGTVVVSGTPIRRPIGQRRPGDDGMPGFGPTQRLDIELEMGFVVGNPTALGTSVSTADAEQHVFGLTLVNDWSARDIQAWEYVPLGPFLGKSFATSVSPWVVPLDALESFRVDPPPQEPEPLPYLQSARPMAYSIDLEIGLQSSTMAESGTDPHVISRVDFASMYWSIDQQLAHLTVNGASLRAGDLCASGTISGPEVGQRGSLIETTWNGADPIDLPDGSTRTFLEDGDRVVLRGVAHNAESRVDFGEVWGEVVPALD